MEEQVDSKGKNLFVIFLSMLSFIGAVIIIALAGHLTWLIFTILIFLFVIQYRLNHWLYKWINSRLQQDLSRIRKTEKALEESKRELTIRNKISNIFLTISDDEMYAEVLQVILKLMESSLGYFGYIGRDGALVCPSLTGDVWEECRITDKDIVFPRQVWGGIWGKSLMEKKTIISNQPLSVPNGHIPLSRALVVPIIYKGELIGQIAVANKENDYTSRDQELLENIVGHIAPVLQARLQRDRQARERKQMEEQIRVERDNVQRYFDSAKVIIGVVDHDQKVGLINKHGCESMGYKKEEVINQNCFKFFPEGIRDKVKETFEILMSGENEPDEYIEYPVLTKSGAERIIAWHYTLLRDEKQKITGFLVSGEDITARKRAEEEFRQAEIRYRILFEHSPDGILIIDPQTMLLSPIKNEPTYRRK